MIRRRPRLLLTQEQVAVAVNLLLREPVVVIDIETTKRPPRWNELLWVGLASQRHTFLIPCGHPKGVLITPAHKVKKPAIVVYGENDPRGLTKMGKPSLRMVDVPVPASYAKPPKQLWPNEVCELIRPVLFNDGIHKLGHHVKFDIESLAKYYGGEIPPGPFHDTLLIRHIVDENLLTYKLKDLTRSWLHLDKQKYPDMGSQGVENFGLDEAASYLTKDLRYCWLMFRRWYQMLERRGLLPVYEFEMSLYPVLMQMEYTGFPINPEALGSVREGLEASIYDIEQAVYKRAGGEFPLSNLAAKRWVLFGHGDPVGMLKTENLKPLSLTPKEKLPQLNKATLEHYSHRNEMARLFMEWSAFEKLRGTFVVGLHELIYEHPDGLKTIHTSFKQHGTVTGRLSAEQPNLQQLPRGPVIRQLFIAGTDHVLIVADYDQIELRGLAHFAQEPTMILIFQQGRDIHSEATVTAMQITLDMVTDSLRQVGKTLNFATGYGAGAERIAAVAGVSKRQGQRFLDRYYEEFSALEPWKRRLLVKARKAGDRSDPLRSPPYVSIPPFGRLRRLPDLDNYTEANEWKRYRAERQAVNAVVQGFASNITKQAMLDLAPKLAPYPAQMVLQVHDELVVRVEKSYVDEVMPIVTETMSGVSFAGQPALGVIPLVVSAKVGYTWAEAKGK